MKDTDKQISLIGRLYERIARDRLEAIEGVDPHIVRALPRNFFVLLVSHIFTKIGDGLLNPKTTLTWLMSSLNVPVFLTGLLVPLRESGSMLPQALISGWIQSFHRRKNAWIIGSLSQGLCVLGMAVVAWTLSGKTAGLFILALLLLFSLARSICSISGKDLMGRAIPKRRRGRLSGWQTGVAGAVILGVGLFLGSLGGEQPETSFLGALLLTAAVLWWIGAAFISLVAERPSSRDANKSDGLFGRISMLHEDAPFRRFVLARALMMGSALVAPYYVMLAQTRTTGSIGTLGYLIFVSGMAQMLSSVFWGSLSDRSSRAVMISASMLAGVLGLVVLAAEWVDGVVLDHAVWHAGVFFTLMVAHSGIRVGRKTFVVDLGGDDKRAHYVAVSNTVMGVLLLVVGSIGAVFGGVSPLAAIGFFTASSLGGALYGLRLPNVTR